MPTNRENEIKKLKAEIARLKKLVVKDELTGVLNRKGVKEEFEILFKEASYAKKHSKAKRKIHIDNLSVIFIDVDDFKKVNDTFGHSVGDRVLKLVAATLGKKVREIDLLGRIGGEEFVIVLAGATEDEAYKKAEEIRKFIKRKRFIPNRADLKITLSIGVASLKKTNAGDIMELISRADKAMYEAKTNRGKDNTVKYSEISPKSRVPKRDSRRQNNKRRKNQTT